MHPTLLTASHTSNYKRIMHLPLHLHPTPPISFNEVMSWWDQQKAGGLLVITNHKPRYSIKSIPLAKRSIVLRKQPRNPCKISKDEDCGHTIILMLYANIHQASSTSIV